MSVTKRDIRLDIIRGLALVTVTINHITQLCRDMGLSGPSFPTPSKFTISSSMETFILISGILIGIIYTKVFVKQGWRALAHKTLGRLGQIVSVQLFVAASVLVLLLAGSSALSEANYMQMVSGPWDAMWKTATGAMPFAMNVLPLYILLLAWAPFQVVGMARWPWIMVGLSVLLYVLAHMGLNMLAVLPEGAPKTFGKGYFNPFSYQLLFLAGVVWGQGWGTWWPKVEAFAQKHIWALSAVNIGLMGVCVAMKAGIIGGAGSVFERSDIDAAVIVSGVLLAAWLFVLLKRFPVLTANILARFLGRLGQASLLVFGAGITLTYLIALLWEVTGGGTVNYYVWCLVSIGALYGVREVAARFDGKQLKASV